jgi:hypothetical protein
MPSFTITRQFAGRTLAIVALPMTMLMTLAVLAMDAPAEVIALNQKIQGDSVSITYAYLPKNGTLAIFSSDARGHMGRAPIGRVALLVGDHRNFIVTLNPAPESGTQLWAVLEQSTGNMEPFKRFDGGPVEEGFKAL